ncbi:GxxExxY protein [Jejuia pallidilutea]|uniref:GxxExxY protein n=1 Tax=Jejuia pallidilutea TaxID=504487 RepID=A0A090WKS9_9FLAO|nr:hypothetical protein JCM19301_1159 [Jejuia pallidilutea]GAL71794.1 hypothetical protein JCM19302_1944 [Jejuia pallidilutea]GAL91062.1 hypothetical protein JCM19538_2676 [Jejuia pallidilutea]
MPIRIDLLVENSIVLELKTVENLTYMKLGNYPLGLFLNFKTKLLKNGIKRFINTVE